MTVETHLDLAYGDGHAAQRLDLHVPAHVDSPPTVVFVHGGAFFEGDKSDGAGDRLRLMAEHGLAVASINYRLLPDAHFPDQLHDVKAAIRWLRGHQGRLGIDASHIGAWGASAGAYLCLMAAATNGRSEWEGDVGEHAQEESRVQSVVNWFGQTDLLASASRTPLERRILIPPVEAGLLGVPQVEDVAEVAARLSPINIVDGTMPPVLTVHGDRDKVISLVDAFAFHDRLVRLGATSTFTVVGGAGHEDAKFDDPSTIALCAGFLTSRLT